MTEQHASLIRALRDASNLARVDAAEALGRLDAAEAIGPLIAALGTCIVGDYDHEQCVAQAALVTMGRGQHRALVNAALAEFLRARPPGSHARQVLVVQVLAAVGDAACAGALAELLAAHAPRLSSDPQSAWVATEIATAIGDNRALASQAAHPALLTMRAQATYEHQARAVRYALAAFANPTDRARS